MRPLYALSFLAIASLAACNTVPEPAAPPVVVEAPPVQTCASVATLQRVVIPAETKVQYAITEIENPPYEPISTRVKQVRVVKPAEVMYIDSTGKEVFDICEDVEIGPTGPGEGEILPDA